MINKNFLIVLFALFALFSYQATHALFSDTATSSNNTFTASDSFPGPIGTGTPTPTITPTSTPTLTPTSTPPQGQTVIPGDVVINELNWAGGLNSSNDEWIELKNTTPNIINLSGWQITNLVGGDNHEALMLSISSGFNIQPNGYFLISYYNEATTSSSLNITPDIVSTQVNLRNTNLQIKLYKSTWTNVSNLIDTADDGDGSPLRGLSGTPNKSMERKAIPGDGTVQSNWQTASTHTNMDGSTVNDDFGTPKAQNGI